MQHSQRNARRMPELFLAVAATTEPSAETSKARLSSVPNCAPNESRSLRRWRKTIKRLSLCGIDRNAHTNTIFAIITFIGGYSTCHNHVTCTASGLCCIKIVVYDVLLSLNAARDRQKGEYNLWKFMMLESSAPSVCEPSSARVEASISCMLSAQFLHATRTGKQAAVDQPVSTSSSLSRNTPNTRMLAWLS